MSRTHEQIRIPSPRLRSTIGFCNVRGVWTLYRKEMQQFLLMTPHTLGIPAVTSVFFLAVFFLSLGGEEEAMRIVQVPGGMDISSFLSAGLIMMIALQSAFAGTAFSLVFMKMQGNIHEFLMPPLSPAEQAVGLTSAGLTQGLLAGVVCYLVMSFFLEVHVFSWLATLYYALSASLFLSLVGMVSGIWARRWDSISGVLSFVVVPFTLLSGTFYSLDNLPEPLYVFTLCNPFFYLIDGFRYGLTGVAQGSLWIGWVFIGVCNSSMCLLVFRLLKSGWRLKS